MNLPVHLEKDEAIAIIDRFGAMTGFKFVFQKTPDDELEYFFLFTTDHKTFHLIDSDYYPLWDIQYKGYWDRVNNVDVEIWFVRYHHQPWVLDLLDCCLNMLEEYSEQSQLVGNTLRFWLLGIIFSKRKSDKFPDDYSPWLPHAIDWEDYRDRITEVVNNVPLAGQCADNLRDLIGIDINVFTDIDAIEID